MNLPFLLPACLAARALQRALLVALLVPLLVLTVLAAVPALTLMPFLPGGTDRTIKLLHAHTTQIRILLSGSRNTPGSRHTARR